jgi:very-short-patch-repair endonuclease
LTEAHVVAGPAEKPRSEHLEQLIRQADSELERTWLRYLEKHQFHLPTHAQRLIESCGTRPDFYYEDSMVAIYVDGHYHEYPERRERDAAYTMCLEDRGYTVIRFGHEDDWASKIAGYPNIFGRGD